MPPKKKETEELNISDLPVMNSGEVKQEVAEESKVEHPKGVPFKTQNGNIRIDH